MATAKKGKKKAAGKGKQVVDNPFEPLAEATGHVVISDCEDSEESPAAQSTPSNLSDSNSPAHMKSELMNQVIHALRSPLVVKEIVDAIYTTVYEKIASELHDSFLLELKKSEDQITSLTASSDFLKKKIVSLESSLDEQEQYSRRQCLRIYGVTEEANENTDKLVLDLATKMKVPLDPRDIDRSHRISPKPVATSLASESASSSTTPKSEPRPKPLIVKFSRYNARQLLYAAKSKLKNSGILIREDLTPFRQNLFYKAMKNENTSYTWSNDGKIFSLTKNGRKIPIRNASDIENLG